MIKTMLNNQITIKLKTLDKKLLNIFFGKLLQLFENRETIIKKITSPKKIKKITTIRSPHVNKKSKEQFEIRYFFLTIRLENLSAQNAGLFLKSFTLLLPLGIAAQYVIKKTI